MNSVSESWTGKRVFVTGAAGFIGSHLTEALLDLGCEVTAMVHYSSRGDWGNLEFLSPDKKAALRVVSGTIEDCNFIFRHIQGQEVVFHLAALIGIPYSYLAPSSYIRTNVEGTTNILEAARSCGVTRVIHTSTSEVYGTALYTPIDEGHPLQPQSPYSASKIGADMLADSFFRSFETPITIARPFNTYGPRQSARAVIPTIISQALSSSPEIRLGSLTPVRDLNFVRDTVRGFISLAQSDSTLGRVVNLGTGKGITVGELAKRILKIADIDKPIICEEARERPRASEVFELIADNRRASQLLDWRPEYSLSYGLAETIDFVRDNMHLFKVEQYAV